ncbi:hypothetical protein [Kitasatospora purpeofusca]|uniref:hypothetical protein n=1 Tax=Kitasatospora purpeofusca TaxID=67352 RepID=UPI00381B658E
MPALHRAALEQARRDGGAAAAYACGCLLEQVLADALACPGAEHLAPVGQVGPAGPDVLAVLDELRLCCAELAALAADGGDLDRVPARTATHALLGRAAAVAAGLTDRLWSAPETVADPAGGALLRHATDWKTPECHAYDLADPDLTYRQAADWLAGHTRPRPVLVVGIRTGGSYLAPFWAAAVAAAGRTAAPWTTLRPLRLPGGITLPEAELDRLPTALPVGTLVVAVDDQPDTGDTARAVRAALVRRLPGRPEVLLASPGRLYRVGPGALRTIASVPPVHPGRERLWQLLAPADRPRLLARIRAAGVPLAADDRDLRVEPFRGPFLTRYPTGPGPAAPGPAGRPGGPHRISPRTTPFTVVGPAHTRHFRFAGTGAHGAQCAAALAEWGGPAPAFRYVDGYLVTDHEPGLRPLADGLPALDPAHRRQVLATVVRGWRSQQRLGDLGRVAPEAGYDPQDALRRALARLRDLVGGPLPVDEAWLRRHVPGHARLGGADGRLLRTSLPYSHQDWHWQLAPAGPPPEDPEGEPDGPPAVRRFGLDWVWGGAGRLESEVASFVVENGLTGEALADLRTALDDDAVFTGALRLGGEALLLNAKSWLRRCPAPGPGTAERIRSRLAELADRVAALS